MNEVTIPQLAAGLVDRSITPAHRRNLTAQVRDSIQIVYSSNYGLFLDHFLPTFVDILTNITKPQWENNDVQKTRSIVLEIMSRFPPNDVLKPKCAQILPLAMNVMQTDNEENSAIAIHIIFDLHRFYRPHLKAQVEPFLSFIRHLYGELPKTVDRVLMKSTRKEGSILPASHSFKVITECPLLVMFLFQLYPTCIATNIRALLPLMLKAIKIEIPPTYEEVRAKPSFKDFIAAQVKTVTFLAYLIRQWPEAMKIDETWIPLSVVQILKACPGDAIVIRKELLVATRGILRSNFRTGFSTSVDVLLDEKVIAGVGRVPTKVLRPLGYQFLAELIHGVRFQLTKPQLTRIISMFSTNLHDPNFSFGLQTNAVRLLLNLVEGILRRKDGTPRSFLVRIMRTMVAKYVTIGDQVPQLLKMIDDAPKSIEPSNIAVPFSKQPFVDPLKEVHDCKILLKTLTLGLKTVVWACVNSPKSKAPPDVPRPKQRNDAKTEAATKEEEMVLLEPETEVLTQLLPAIQKCFELYSHRGISSSPSSETRAPINAEKEIYDQFAQIFTILDVRSFQDIFGVRMQWLLDYTVECQGAIIIAQHFLSNKNVAKYFADLLLGFMVEKLSCLSVARPKPGTEPASRQQKEAASLLTLFKSLFYALQNSLENVLKLHVTTIVEKCVSLALNCDDPYFYLQVLRYLFKSLTRGKKHDDQFDALFRDLRPLVEHALSGLVSLYDGPHHHAYKDIIIELCLLIPAKPATLFPYLKVQIKPIVWALKGSKENVQYGLRALDFWLDILDSSYMDTLLNIVEPDLTIALHHHLRQHAGNTFGTAALRILGKLGARSRRISSQPELPTNVRNNGAVSYKLSWAEHCENSSFNLNADSLIDRAFTVVLNESRDGTAAFTLAQRRLAWQFCRVCLGPYLGLHKGDGLFAAGGSTAGKVSTDMFNSEMSDGFQLEYPAHVNGVRKPRTAEASSVRALLVAVIVSASLPVIASPSPGAVHAEDSEVSPRNFALGLSRYFGIVLGSKYEKPQHESPTSLDPRIFIDAVVQVMSRERRDHREVGVESMEVFLNAILSYSGLAGKVPEAGSSALSALTYLLEKLRHCCYMRKWKFRLAGVAGLGCVIRLIPPSVYKLVFSQSLEVRIVRALMAVAEEPLKNSRFLSVASAKGPLLRLMKVNRDIASEKDCIMEIASCLVSKLSSHTEGARMLAQEALRALAIVLKVQVVDLVRPVKDKILNPLRTRSIRQFSIQSQIGFIDAVNFCLRLDNPFIAADLFVFPLKTSFLSGVLSVPGDRMFDKLPEAEDGFRHKLIDNKLIQTDVVVNLTELRFHVVKLLTTVALRCTNFLKDPSNDEIYRKMITIFFKCLQSRDEKLVAISKVGLKQAISQHTNLKETIQRNLRPIVSNLGDYKKLTLPYLEGLSRVLELLSHWFNANLGDKLLEHLQHWTEPQKIAMLRRGHLGTESKIGAAILELFHLLPPAASMFLERLVIIVIQIEFEFGVAGPGVGRLGMHGRNIASTSPFREPLLKFCNVHSTNAIAYFLSRLSNAPVRHLFFVLLRADKGGPLREKLRSDCASLVDATFGASGRSVDHRHFSYYGVIIITSVLEDAPPKWLAQNPAILANVLKIWNSRAQHFRSAAGRGQFLSTEEIEDHLMLARILMRFCQENIPATAVLFDLLKVFGLRMGCDFSFLKTFLRDIAVSKYDDKMKKNVLVSFLDSFSNANVSQELKVNMLQMSIIPMLDHHLQSLGSDSAVATDSVLDAELIRRIVNELFDRPDDVLKGYTESISAELLQLSALLMQYLPNRVGDHRKALIKFGWAHLKREECLAKHWAFVNLSRFFQTYPAPSKIILQVYVALLREVQGDTQVLVRKALDILATALPRRLEQNPNDEYSLWSRYTQKILVDEAHNVVILVHVWQFVIRHPALFYADRQLLVPAMTSTLRRLSYQSNLTGETRRVALDLAKLIISWRENEFEDSVPSSPPRKKLRTDDENGVENPNQFLPSSDMLNLTINFLIQLPFRRMELSECGRVAKRCILLVDEAIQKCPTTPLKLPNFHKYLVSQENNTPTAPQSKPGTPSTVSAAAGSAAKTAMKARADAMRNERLQNYRIETREHRKAILHSALELCAVFTKHQCTLFVQTNSSILIGLVPVVLSGGDAVAAKLFGTVIADILDGFPELKSKPALPPAALPAGASSAGQTSEQPSPPSSVETFFSTVLSSLETSLKANDVSVNYGGLIVMNELFRKRPEEFKRFRDLLINLFSRLVKETVQPNQAASSSSNSAGQNVESGGKPGTPAGKTSEKNGSTFAELSSDKIPKIAVEGLSKTLCLSVLGERISLLEANHRKSFIHGLCYLIERCVTVEVLLEIVRIVRKWVTWRLYEPAEKGKPRAKEPLLLKEKVSLLLKMIVFERISGPGSQRLMNSFLEVILTVFESKGCANRRSELLPKLEKAFLIGLNSRDAAMRARFFRLFDTSLSRNPLGRLYYILAKQDWSYLKDSYWIKHAVGLLISSVDSKSRLILCLAARRFPRLVEKDKTAMIVSNKKKQPDEKVQEFFKSAVNVTSGSFCQTLRELLFNDDELSYRSWISFFPCVWGLASDIDRATLENSWRSLVLKEHHIIQTSWQRNSVQALLTGAYRSEHVPLIDPEVMLHLGSRWNTWFIVVEWLENRYEACLARGAQRTDGELKAVIHVLAKIYEELKENDHFTGLLRRHSSKLVSAALGLEQRGREDEAQEMYAQLMQQYQGAYYGGNIAGHNIYTPPIAQDEVSFCESRWISCARMLCQWEVLTEFARSVVQSDLLHECLWRTTDFAAMKELLYRHPIEDGPSLRLYQAYIHLQENKLDSADSSIAMGFKKSVERYCSLPLGTGYELASDVACQFQQLVELEESSRILSELNELSRLGGENVNVQNKIDSVKNISGSWRERLPTPLEPLPVWNAILSWRNHINAIVVNQFETLNETAKGKVLTAQNQSDQANTESVRGIDVPAATSEVLAAAEISESLPPGILVMGVNEIACNIHRFARACRKQGQANVAIHALLNLYPFGTMNLAEYFFKTMESAKSFYIGPANNRQYGLNELNRCNMDLFNGRQKAQLFTMKGKFYRKLGKNRQAVESFSIALSLAGDVGSAWFAWANYCDDMEKKGRSTKHSSQWRVSAANCYLQAVRFGSRKARRMVPRLLRLLALDSCSSSLKPGRVSDVLMKFVGSLPAWVWVPWMDQLVRMLSRNEATCARNILFRIVQAYPQAPFFPLKAFLEEREQIDEPKSSLIHTVLKKAEERNSSSLQPGAGNIAGLTRQIKLYAEALQKYHLRYQHVVANKKTMESQISQLNPANPNLGKMRQEYAKLSEEEIQLPKGIQRLKETLTFARRRHVQLRAHLDSGNETARSEPSSPGSSNQAGPDKKETPEQAQQPIRTTPWNQADWLMAKLAKENLSLYMNLTRVLRDLAISTRPELEDALLDFVNSLLYRFTKSQTELRSPNTLGRIREWFDVLNKLPSTKSQSTSGVADLKTTFETELITALAVNPSQDWQPLIACLRKWRNIFQQRVVQKERVLKTENVSRYLIDVVDSEIEIFGQYLVAEAEEMRTDSHIKIARFGSEMYGIWRPVGFMGSFEVLGSDGKAYSFATETNVDRSCEVAEDRMIQLYRLINKSFFGKYAQAARRGIAIQLPKRMRMGRKFVLTSVDDSSNSTFANIFEEILLKQGSHFDGPREKYMERRTRQAIRDEKASRMDAYLHVRQSIPATSLSKEISDNVSCPARLFAMKKKFAASLGTNSVVNYVHGVGNRRLENICFSWNTGAVSDLNIVRSLTAIEGGNSSDVDSVRLTPNLMQFMGNVGVNGPLTACMSIALDALRSKPELLEVYVEFMLYDIVGCLMKKRTVDNVWPKERLENGDDSTQGFSKRLEMMTDEIIGRLKVRKTDVCKLVEDLIAEATNVERLATMEASWQGWF